MFENHCFAEVSPMEIEKLRSFMEVYECRSISKAAENLFLSQPALSRRIQALENELKIELFHRNGTIFEPTEGAKTLYKESSKILRQHDQAIIKLNQFKKGLSGSLRIGMVPYLKIGPTLHAVSKMHELYPDVELSFDCDSHTNVPFFLANRSIDVGITIYGEVRGLENFSCQILSKNTLAILIGRGHRLWNKRPLYAEDLFGETLYYIEGVGNHTLTAISQFYKEQKVVFSQQIPCRSIMELLLYISKGDGISSFGVVASESLMTMRDIIDIVPIERTEMDQGFIVALYDEKNPLARKFVEILKQTW